MRFAALELRTLPPLADTGSAILRSSSSAHCRAGPCAPAHAQRLAASSSSSSIRGLVHGGCHWSGGPWQLKGAAAERAAVSTAAATQDNSGVRLGQGCTGASSIGSLGPGSNPINRFLAGSRHWGLPATVGAAAVSTGAWLARRHQLATSQIVTATSRNTAGSIVTSQSMATLTAPEAPSQDAASKISGGEAHNGLCIYTSGSQVAVQPQGPQFGSSTSLETLSLDLGAGTAQVLHSVPQAGKPLHALGLMGLCKLHTGAALVAITAGRRIGALGGSDVYEVAETKIITAPDARRSKENRELLDLLEEAVNPDTVGRGVYFSTRYDLTTTTQRADHLKATDPAYATQSPAQHADLRFFWNRALARPLINAGADKFVVPCILGFVEQLPNLSFTDQATKSPVSATLTLVARRAVARSGTRQWRRGADYEGNVANFAETEQILTIDGPPGHPHTGDLASFLIVRGSIPLLWTQLPNIKYKPTTLIAPADQSGPVHDKHFSTMVDNYKGVVAINLINHHGTEGRLEAAFRSEAARLIGNSNVPLARALRYVAFDFHAECGNKRYHRLSVLWDQISQDFATQAFFLRPSSKPAEHKQTGVMRINCIDCLDRTNVVQGVLARKSLEAMLATFNLMPPSPGLATTTAPLPSDGAPPQPSTHLATLPEAYPEVERLFKILWADHGDALSTQYAGTGAMKSGFTRTGVRTTAGAIDDGLKAVMRYYLNNYKDGRKQDAIDLFTGVYQPDGVRPPPIKPQPSPVVPLILAMMSFALGVHNFAAILRYGSGAAAMAAHATRLGVGAAAGAAATAATGGGVTEAAIGAAAVAAGTEVAGPVAQVAQTITGGARQLLSAVLLTGPPDGSVPGDAGSVGGVAVTNASAAAVSEAAASLPSATMLTMTHVVLPVLLGIGLFALIVENGKHLVNKPQLCPQLALTVEKPAKGSKTKKAH